MPHLSTIGSYLTESKRFCTLDTFKGFWQIHIAGNIESQSMLTPLGIFTPLRLPQGNLNSVFAFQRSLDFFFRPQLSVHQLLIWVNDLLVHAPDDQSLLTVLQTIFGLCRKFYLKLNAARCNLYSTQAFWCGMIYSETGVSHDPERALALCNSFSEHVSGSLYIFPHLLKRSLLFVHYSNCLFKVLVIDQENCEADSPSSFSLDSRCRIFLLNYH